MTRSPRTDSTDVFFSCVLCVGTAAVLLFVEPKLSHWATIAITACGCIAGVDAVRVVRGKLDLLDPVGVIGLIGLHFFFLAPLLHVVTRYWMWLEPVNQPLDWRPWIGLMAVFNGLGLLMYRLGYLVRFPERQTASRPLWSLQPKRIYAFAAVLLPISLLLQMYVYRSFGGILGYIELFGESSAQFQGLGYVFAISELFPFILFMVFIAYFRGKPISKTYWFIALVLVLLLLLRIYFGGLRGSRANYVWYMVWVGAVSHVYFRKIRVAQVVPVVALVIAFSTFYWYYKVLGPRMFEREGRQTIENYETHDGGVLTSVLLGDLGRADVQSFVLYQTLASDVYDLAGGQTYLYGLLLPIPDAIVSDRPRSKVEVGTEALYGRGHKVPGGTMSSRVYGLAGEAMINFGPGAIPFAFFAFGLFVGAVRRFRANLSPTDARHIIYPFLMVLCLQLIFLDLENVIYYTLTVGGPPAGVIWASSKVRRLVAVRRRAPALATA